MFRSSGGKAADPRGGRSAPLLVVGTALGMAGGFAVLFSASFGIFLKPIGQEFGWGRLQVSVLTIMGFLGYALGAPMLGVLSRRLGTRQVLIGGIVLFSAGLATLGQLPANLPGFALCCLVIGLAGAVTAPTGYVLILSRHFDRRLGLAIGCAMVGLGIGMAIIPSIAQVLVGALGWRHAYAALGVIGVSLGSGAMLLGAGQSGTTEASRGEADLLGVSLREAVRSWRFWLIGGTALIVGTAGFGAAAHLVAALTDHGATPVAAAGIAGLTGIGILVGRIGAAIMMDRVFAPMVATICCLLGAVGLLLLDFAPVGHPVLLALGALMMGLLVGSEGDAMPFLTRRYFGMASFGSIFGCIVGLAALGGIFGPLAFGLSFDVTGSYATAFTLGAIAAAASGLSYLTLGPYRFGASLDQES